MRMKTASIVRSPCEVLRKLNDKFQGDSVEDAEIRGLLSEAQKKTKQISQELDRIRPNFWLGWWEKNENYKEDRKNRNRIDYKIG